MSSYNNLNSKLNNPGKIPLLMGILNVTPDSFSDGNLYLTQQSALKQAERLIREGADIIDIGGESSRPGSAPVTLEVELDRVIPVIKGIRDISDVPISIDTMKSEVAKVAVENGVNIINDVSSGTFDDKMLDLVAALTDVIFVIMHMQGTPLNMQNKPCYSDVMTELKRFFTAKIENCKEKGIKTEQLWLDPGIGFGKTLVHNLTIINKIDDLMQFSLPVLIGVSRKRFISDIYLSETGKRLSGTLAAGYLAYQNGASILRIHDVFEHKQFFEVIRALKEIT
jgi:dihydropteroate synthase